MPSGPASITGAGQIVVFETKQMPIVVSQQLEAVPAGGQLFWQSESLTHLGTHCGPLDELVFEAEEAPPAPPAPVKSSESLPEAQAMTTPEGRSARASTVMLAYFTGL
jgi:hypothetical protein